MLVYSKRRSKKHIRFRESNVKLSVYWIDLFCGAGGTTTGIHMSDAKADVIACVNHDPEAIRSHQKNHPNCLHLTEDIRDWKVIVKLKKIVDDLRRAEPHCIINIWASLECTHFSKAKGGMSREADSRTLAEHLYEYIDHLNPAYVYIENVREFLSWGPLMQDMKVVGGAKKYKAHITDKKSKVVWMDLPLEDNEAHYKRRDVVAWMVPDKSKLCSEYNLWRDTIKGRGYDYNYSMMNAADFGEYTSRDRYFGIFGKEGFPIEFPKQTHIRKSRWKSNLGLKLWMAVKEVLELTNEGKSIFGRKKDLVDNTLERIYAGLLKFIANGDESFLKKYYSGRPEGKVISLNGPAGTIKTKDGQALVKCNFLLDYQRKNGMRDLDTPCPTLMTHDSFAKVQTQFLVHSYSGKENIGGIDKPIGTITSVPKGNLTTTKWIMNNNSSTATNKGIDEPVPTITQRTHYILNPQYKNKGSSIENPAPTIIARQDKAPLYLISGLQYGGFAIPIYDTDSEIKIKIKIFMVHYGIADIKMRMLTVNELKRIQGFPEDYVLTGNQTQQKKSIGNSVAPKVAKKLVECNYDALSKFLSIDKVGRINMGALHLLNLL